MENNDQQRKQLVKKLRTLWHPLIYHLKKNVLIPRDVEVEFELNASELPPQIDMVLRHHGDRWSEEQRAVLPDGVRDRHCKHHLFEFKITESVNIKAFTQADVYEHLYPQLRKVKDHEFQTYIVSSRTTLADNLKAWDYSEAEHPGVYTSTHPRFDYIVLLLLNELRDLPHNNYLRLFASKRKVRESALESLLQTHASYLSDDPTEAEIISAIFAVAKAHNIEVEGLSMENELTVEWLLERGNDMRLSLIESALESASIEERLEGLEPEQVLSMYKPEQVLSMYKPEQVLGMYKPEERVIGLKPEERVMGLKPEERVMGLKPEERVMGLKPEERVMGLKPEERVMGLKPEQIVGAYKFEEKRLLMEALQRSIEMDETMAEAASEQSGELECGEDEPLSDSPALDEGDSSVLHEK